MTMESFESANPTGPHSRVQPEGSLKQNMYPSRGGANMYQEDGRNETSFILEDYNAKQQFIISQVASLIMNVANVFPYKTKPDEQKFMSPNVSNQHNYDTEKVVNAEDQILFGLLFGDLDHLGNDNHFGGVFFDFGSSDMLQNKTKYGNSYGGSNHQRTHWYVDAYKKDGLDIEAMKAKCNVLCSQLSGESGLQFITALCAKAEYTEITPEKIQERFLAVIQKSLDKLAKVK